MIELTCKRCKGEFEVEGNGDGRWAGLARAYVHYCEPCLAGMEAETAAIAAEQEARLTRARIEANLPKIFHGVSLDNEDGRHPDAWEAARQWIVEGGTLVLLGPAGTGKSHLAAVAAKRVMSGRNVTWVSVPSLLLNLSAAYDSDERAAALKAIKGKTPLVLDDLDKTSGSEWARAQLFAAIDNQITEGRPLIVTANTTREQMENKLGSPIASRLLASESLVCVMSGSDRRRERTNA